MKAYTVSQDPVNGLWYCHLEGHSYVPCMGSLCKRKSDAKEYAKMYNGLPHKVETIEKRINNKLINKEEL